MNAIDQTMKQLRTSKRAAFIPYLTVGDPSLTATLDLLLELQNAGADMIELGVPYSDPLADGPVIQEASMRALRNQVSVIDVIGLAKLARQAGVHIPLILFTYYNPILKAGLGQVFKLMHESSIDGVIVPDLPIEESSRVRAHCSEFSIHYIPLVAPTSRERVKMIADKASGFIYCVSSLGVTGQRQQFHQDIEAFLREVRKATSLPIVVGFGISSPEQYRTFAKLADGVVVGSAIVQQVGANLALLENPESYSRGIHHIKAFISTLIGKQTTPF
ncbi:tryptophan synthase, alpha subunit [Paenibacillus curdlanolyticus YK9]|uniref:Tryptophan synthase alpha chain n=1 Tax=Paenibacillus curdlanolyticus YK9 TaxID=717606 RepID=E0I5M1_9BACL|nr:tryptophan synthase subunit alpha [Paenibacillus curdlanolyticus]EFM12263.1 tryptophan synthase, alpha subunit [Paenibacillus curdlanolyticus YK9]